MSGGNLRLLAAGLLLIVAAPVRAQDAPLPPPAREPLAPPAAVSLRLFRWD